VVQIQRYRSLTDPEGTPAQLRVVATLRFNRFVKVFPESIAFVSRTLPVGARRCRAGPGFACVSAIISRDATIE
jgi:hypothetical protein